MHPNPNEIEKKSTFGKCSAHMQTMDRQLKIESVYCSHRGFFEKRIIKLFSTWFGKTEVCLDAVMLSFKWQKLHNGKFLRNSKTATRLKTAFWDTKHDDVWKTWKHRGPIGASVQPWTTKLTLPYFPNKKWNLPGIYLQNESPGSLKKVKKLDSSAPDKCCGGGGALFIRRISKYRSICQSINQSIN